MHRRSGEIRSVRRPALIAATSASVALAACAPQRNAPASEQLTGDRCIVRETSRTPLVVDGNRELYVEPDVVSPSGRSILLAGRPNYLFSSGPWSNERSVTRDSVFGAVLDARGRARLVPSPIDPALVTSPRARSLGSDRWALVFGEMKQPWVPPRSDTIVRLWYGEFDGRTWSALEPLPEVPRAIVNLELGSDLVARGDTLYIAAVVDPDSGSRRIALFERHAGRWKVEPVDVGNGAAYVELLASDSSELLLAVVQADPSLPRDRNSLLLYGNRPRWRILRSVIRGGEQPIHDPRFSTSSEGVVLSWYVMDDEGSPPAQRARAMFGMTAARNGRIVELDPDINFVAPFLHRSGFPIWATEHTGPGGARELRFVADSAGHARVLTSYPSPFTGPFAATAVGASDLLISGPLFHADSARPRLVTLLIRARVECR